MIIRLPFSEQILEIEKENYPAGGGFVNPHSSYIIRIVDPVEPQEFYLDSNDWEAFRKAINSFNE